MLKYNITPNKVAIFLILYTFEDFVVKYTLKITESVGSTNILYMFMNTSVRYVRYTVIPSKCKRTYLCKKNCFTLQYVKNSWVWLGPTFVYKITARKGYSQQYLRWLTTKMFYNGSINNRSFVTYVKFLDQIRNSLMVASCITNLHHLIKYN